MTAPQPNPAPPPPPLPPHRRRRAAVAVLPSLFTLGNLLCGFAALHYAALGDPTPVPPISNYAIAGYFIFAAMLFDVFDGFLARLARATSDFGAELDSLADMVSFGVAPAFLSLELIQDMLKNEIAKVAAETQSSAISYYEVGPNATGALRNLFWVIGALYVCCTALRLARFNVLNKHDDESHQAFRGLPSPGAAGVVASSIIFFFTLRTQHHLLPFHVSAGVREHLETIFPYLIPAMLLVSALLMVSRFSYAHLINRFLRGRRRFNYMVAVLLIILLTVWQPQITALLAIYIYALSAPFAWAYRLIIPAPPAPLVAPAPTEDDDEDDEDDDG